MVPAIATGCVTSERIAEAVHKSLQHGVRGFFLQASQWLVRGEGQPLPEYRFPGAAFLGFYEAISEGGCSLFGAESERQHGRERLRSLCVDAHRAGGSFVLLGGQNAREMEVRATTSEIHARLADFFDGVISVFESRNIMLVIDICRQADPAKRYCLSGLTDVMRFLEYYRHPLVRIGLRTSQFDAEKITGELFSDKVLPYLSVVTFDNLLERNISSAQRAIQVLRHSYKGIILLGCAEQASEGVARLSRELEKLKSLMEA